MTLNIQEPQPIDPEHGTELMLEGLDLDAMKRGLEEQAKMLRNIIDSSQEARAAVNAHASTERARITREAEVERERLSALIADARAKLKDVERFLNATKPRTRKAKKAS